MSDFTASRPGAVNATGDARALFLKKFAGEVLTTFEETNVMLGLHTVRTISQGKTAQFPATGVATASYHVPGTELNGQAIKHAELTINVDQLLVADCFIGNIDEAMNHYDVRSIYSTECGRALSVQMDKRLLRVAVLAARASAAINGGKVGGNTADANVASNAVNLASAIFAAANAFDSKDVPQMDRYVVVQPAQYYMLVKDTTAINKWWTTGANGSYDKGTVLNVAGINIVKSNHVPTVNASAVTGEENTYSGTFNTTVAVAFQRGAIGTLRLMDLATESEYSVRHQGTLVVAKYAMGHGILRPECAWEIKTA